MLKHIIGEMNQKAVMKDQGRVLWGEYFDCQNLVFITYQCSVVGFVWMWVGGCVCGIWTYSGEIILATAAATIHEDIRQSFLVWPVVVVPAQFKPRR